MKTIKSNLKLIYITILIAYGVKPIFAILQGISFFSNSIYAIDKFIPMIVAGLLPYFLSQKQDGYKVIYGIISYLILTTIINSTVLNEAFFYMERRADVSSAYIKNVLTGILCGYLSYWIANYFEKVKMPMIFSFFQGKRLVPICCMICMTVVALPMYFLWKNVFYLFMNIMDFFNNNGLYSFANIFDIALTAFGLHNILNKFYIFPNINQLNTILLGINLLIYFLLILLNRKNKVSVFVLIYFCLGTIATKNSYMISYLLLFLSLKCWFIWIGILMSVVLAFQYSYVFGVVGIFLIIIFYYFQYKQGLQLDFYEGHKVKADRIIEYVGGFENIKNIRLIHNYEMVIEIYNMNFVLPELREYINYSIQGQELIIHLNAINIGVYDEINEMMNMNLQDLLL